MICQDQIARLIIIGSEDLDDNEDNIYICREQISLQHQLVPKYMQTWNIDKARAAAQKKMELMKILKKEMMTLMPSTLMELYEMYRIAAVRALSFFFDKIIIMSSQYLFLDSWYWRSSEHWSLQRRCSGIITTIWRQIFKGFSWKTFTNWSGVRTN